MSNDFNLLIKKMYVAMHNLKIKWPRQKVSAKIIFGNFFFHLLKTNQVDRK